MPVAGRAGMTAGGGGASGLVLAVAMPAWLGEWGMKEFWAR